MGNRKLGTKIEIESCFEVQKFSTEPKKQTNKQKTKQKKNQESSPSYMFFILRPFSEKIYLTFP